MQKINYVENRRRTQKIKAISAGSFSFPSDAKAIGQRFRLTRILLSDHSQYGFVKALFGLPIGLGFGFLIHALVVDRLRLGEFVSSLALGFLAGGCAFGYARTVKFRAFLWLALPAAAGKSGRSVLLAVALGAALEGPAETTVYNLKVRNVVGIYRQYIKGAVQRLSEL